MSIQDNNNARTNYVNNSRDNVAATQFLSGILGGGNINNMSPGTRATALQIVSMLSKATSGFTGIDTTSKAASKFDTVNNAITGTGGMNLYGTSYVQGYGGYGMHFKNYGYAHGAGNLGTNLTMSALGQLDRSYSGRDSEIAAALFAEKVSQNGIGTMARNIDLGDGSPLSVGSALSEAYANKSIDFSTAKDLGKSVDALQIMNKVAYDMLDKKGLINAGEERDDLGANYFNRDSEVRQAILDKVAKDNGLVNGDTKYGTDTVDLARIISEGGATYTHIDAGQMTDMMDGMKENLRVLKEVEEDMGVSVNEMQQFARQTGMGALSSKRTIDNIKDWMTRTRHIAAGSGRNLSDVVAEQGKIADALTGTGAVVTADKVASLSSLRDGFVRDEANGGSVYSTEKRTAMAVRNTEKASFNNRGLHLARELASNGFMDAAVRDRAAQIQERLESEDITFTERGRLNKEMIKLARENGLDVSNKDLMASLERKHSRQGDIDRTTRQSARENARKGWLRGKSGKALRNAFGASNDAKIADSVMTLFDAVGQDDADLTKSHRLIGLADAARNMDAEERQKYYESLKEDEGMDSYELDAVDMLSTMSADQVSALMNAYHGSIKHGGTMASLKSRSQELKDRKAASADFMKKLADKKVGNVANNDSMLKQFVGAIMGTTDLEDSNIAAGILTKAESARVAAGNSDDAGLVEFAKGASVTDLLNANLEGMGLSEDERVEYGANAFNVHKDAFDADGRLGASFKAGLLDSRNTEWAGTGVQEYFASRGIGAEELKNMEDGEILQYIKEATGGELAQTDYGGLFVATGQGIDAYKRNTATLRDKNKSLAEAYGGVENMAKNLDIDADTGRIHAIMGVTKDENGKLQENMVGLDDLANPSKMSDSSIAKTFGKITGSDGKERNVTRADILDTDEDGHVLGIKKEFAEKYGRQASAMQEKAAKQQDVNLPDYVKNSLQKLMENSNEATKKIKGLSFDGDRLKVDD